MILLKAFTKKGLFNSFFMGDHFFDQRLFSFWLRQIRGGRLAEQSGAEEKALGLWQVVRSKDGATCWVVEN